MKDDLSVSSGQVKSCKGEGILRGRVIGSCVVVAAYDPQSSVGGMAHVMIPGASCDENPSRRTRYAEDAVEEMMAKMATLGAQEARGHACLVGGANMLGDGHDSPGLETVRSVTETLRRKGTSPVAMEVGGTKRRSCCLDVGRGRVSYTIGDSQQRVLWEAGAPRCGPDSRGRPGAPEGGKGVKA